MYNTIKDRVKAGDDVEKTVRNYIKEHNMIQPGDHVITGVSGGPDSMALMAILWNLKQEMGFDLTVAHVHHGLRGEEADQDQELVAAYCKTHGIAYASTKVDVAAWAKEKGLGIEEAGREVRYLFFRSLAKEGKETKIATGHHRDDQVETVLMRIVRGTGLIGLRGIEPMRKDGVIRPFLSVWKSEILAYCADRSIPYRLDDTNYQSIYHRNKLRLELIPLLKEYNPAVEDALLRISEQAEENESYLQKRASESWAKCNQPQGLDVELFLLEEPLMQKRLLLRAVENSVGRATLESRHYQMMVDKIKDEESTVWQLDLPGGIRLRRSYGHLLIEEQSADQTEEYFEYPVLPGKIYGFPRLGFVLETRLIDIENIFEKSQNADEYDLDYDRMEKISARLVVRQRKPGDRLLGPDAAPAKKVKKVFIDKKVPVEERDRAACFATEAGVLWIPGVAASCCFAVKKDTTRVLRMVVHRIQEEKDD